MNTTSYDVIEIAEDNYDYDDPVADLGRLAVQHNGEFVAYADDLEHAATIIGTLTGADVTLTPAYNYFSGSRWIVRD